MDRSTQIAAFEKLLASGRDDALLRFSLGSAYLNSDAPDKAIGHFSRAVELNPDYSAAWKLLGRALSLVGNADQALLAYNSGVAAAERKGDIQAMKEMQVFMRRLHRPRTQ